MNCLFIYNPCSGKGKINKYVKYITNALKDKFQNVTVMASTRPKEMAEMAKNACGKYEGLLFSGGDGSFNEIINGVATEENIPILAYIPTGTVNDIAHSLGIPRSIKKAVKHLLKCEARELDVMKINSKYAEYVVCAGAMTSCSYSAPHNEKVKLGKMAYAFEMLRHNMNFKDFEIEIIVDGAKTIKTNCEFVLFLNSRSVGSVMVNSKAVLDDGEIELIIVKQVKQPKWYHKVLAFFGIIGFFALGYQLSSYKEIYEKVKGSHFEIHAPKDLVWNYDGEEGETGDITLDVLRKKIKIISNKKNG